MDLDIYAKPLEFIERNPTYGREISGLAKAILLNEVLPTLSSECKQFSIDEQIIKNLETNEFITTETLHFFYVLDFLALKVNELKSTAQWGNFFSN